MRILADRDLGQAFVPADSVVGVDDQVARRKGRDLGKERVRALPPRPAPDEAVAKHILLGKDRYVRGREAVIERKHDQRRLGLAAERFLPAVDFGLSLEA